MGINGVMLTQDRWMPSGNVVMSSAMTSHRKLRYRKWNLIEPH